MSEEKTVRHVIYPVSSSEDYVVASVVYSSEQEAQQEQELGFEEVTAEVEEQFGDIVPEPEAEIIENPELRSYSDDEEEPDVTLDRRDQENRTDSVNRD